MRMSIALRVPFADAGRQATDSMAYARGVRKLTILRISKWRNHRGRIRRVARRRDRIQQTDATEAVAVFMLVREGFPSLGAAAAPCTRRSDHSG